MNKTKMSMSKIAAITAAGIAGVLPATATTATPGNQSPTVRTAPKYNQRKARRDARRVNKAVKR